jgi:hypothetical protein
MVVRVVAEVVVAEVEIVVVTEVVVVAEVIVTLAAQTIFLMKGMVLIDVCRKNYNNPAIYFFKTAEIVCTRLILIFPT